ncbi:MAG TPA: 2Fe-2S iron-sulfur cluster-binding protein [Steroidobacter sp.]|nr:2Fe-2S iron-sulfur cluster-binding protein [Steroidobacter sp.]
MRELARTFFDVATVDEYFVCGPGSMVEDVSRALRELGASGKIHTELFSTADRAAAPAAPPTVSEREAAAAGRSTAVEIVMDGRRRRFDMLRDGSRSVLDAAARAGIELPYSCRAGVCSTCRTKVVRGEVRMERNLALEDWEIEAGYVLCCQAHPLSEQLELTYDE